MGRGEGQLEEKPKGNLLFNPPRRNSRSIFDLKGKEAFRKGEEIARNLADGDVLTLLLPSLEGKGRVETSLVFLYAFELFMEGKVDPILEEKKLPRRAKGLKHEKGRIEKEMSLLLLDKIGSITRDDSLGPGEKEEAILGLMKPDYDLFLDAAKRTEGPLHEALLERFSCQPLKEASVNELDFLLEEESNEAWEAMLRREIFAFIFDALPRSTWNKQARYGVFNGFQHEGVMHIITERGKTFCGNNSGTVFHKDHVAHGSWHDKKVLGQRKQCSRCKKLADKELLAKIEEERGDNQSEYFGARAQELVASLSASEELRRMVKEDIERGSGVEEVRYLLRLEVIDQVAEIMQISSDSEEALFLYGGGGNFLWSGVDRQRSDRLKEAGYPVPDHRERASGRRYFNYARPEDFRGGLAREDDILGKIISAEDKREYMKYLLRIRSASNHTESDRLKREAQQFLDGVLDKALAAIKA